MDEGGLIIESGDLRVDIASRRLFIGSRFVFLRNKEFSLLEYLLRNPNRVLTRTQILEDVWDRNIFCSTNTVDVHMRSLRKKLGTDLNQSIRTVHCVGYIFES